MLSIEDTRTAAAFAIRYGIEPAALEAVIEVESGGRVFARVDGRDEPLIRWEAHYFDRLCGASVRAQARAEGLASPRAGAIANPPGQAARWGLLRRAAALDRAAAYQSTSWGVGQVMGAHWQALGYADVDALVAGARSGLAGQLDLTMRFIAHNGLLDTLRAKDWTGFARGYNGPAFAGNDYGERLRNAYLACRDRDPGDGGERMLARGMKGEAVRALQRQLTACGLPLAADGVFGGRTDAAVRRFQRSHGLVVDGIVGPMTRAALAAEDRKRKPSRLGRLFGLLKAFVRFVWECGKI